MSFSNPALKLPKGISDPTMAQAIENWFRQNQAPIRPDSEIGVTALTWSESVSKAIQSAHESKHLLQGLELIKRAMQKEQHGLEALAKKTNGVIPERLSRFLILSCDGSERFYRQTEAVLLANKNRMAGCIVTADANTLGELFSKKKQPLKALLIDDRVCLEQFLVQVIGPIAKK